MKTIISAKALRYSNGCKQYIVFLSLIVTCVGFLLHLLAALVKRSGGKHVLKSFQMLTVILVIIIISAINKLRTVPV